jgi:hypothetical protein
MPTIRFTGKELPRSARLTFTIGHKLRWPINPTIEVGFDVSIQNGLVTVECECPADIDSEILTGTYLRATDFTKAVIDLISFSTGIGFSVTLDKYISPLGLFSDMMPEDKDVPALCTAYGLDAVGEADYHKVFNIIMAEPPIFMALNDLVVAISQPHASPVNCYRAVEGIRHLIAPGLDAKKQWPLMNEALRLQQSYVDVVRINATENRHGNRIPVPGVVLREIVRKSWTIMNRFLEYKKRGGVPLPQPEFPTLT